MNLFMDHYRVICFIFSRLLYFFMICSSTSLNLHYNLEYLKTSQWGRIEMTLNDVEENDHA